MGRVFLNLFGSSVSKVLLIRFALGLMSGELVFKPGNPSKETFNFYGVEPSGFGLAQWRSGINKLNLNVSENILESLGDIPIFTNS